MKEDEAYWKQRSRADWLKARDKNTKFFHAKASSRIRKIMIERVKDKAGNWLENIDDVDNRFCQYFQDFVYYLQAKHKID